jgi:two-component system nitrogen regulation response regulator GlnG
MRRKGEMTAAMSSLLVVDDEPAVLQLFRRVFRSQEYSILTAETAEDGLRLVREEQPDTVILDVLLPDSSGLDVFAEIRRIDPKLPVIFMTASRASGTAIEAMKLGALDYMVKPLDFAEVRKLVSRGLAIRRLMNEPVELDAAPESAESEGDALVGRCPGMQQVYKAIGRVASQNVTVLIRGESGTGKELVARALYQHSNRSSGPFLAVNCAAIPETLLESELFGHEKGSFTGADRKRIGKFEQCDGGTLFLDEIGDMSPVLQSKLLRVLQEQRFERVGGNDTIGTDVRVIAATNRNLERMVADNQFRSDLYYRLNGYTVSLPPLRDRGDDLGLLIDHFRREANLDLKKEIRRFAPESVDLLKTYSWPGNVRELQSVIRQAILQSSGQVVIPDFLPDFILAAATVVADSDEARAVADPLDEFIGSQLRQGTVSLYDDVIACVERKIISTTLRHVAGNQAEAARILGVTRTTLRQKIQKLGIRIDRTVQADE